MRGLVLAVALVAVATPAFADDAAARARIDKARTMVLTDEYQGELDDHADDGVPHEQHAEHRDDRSRIDTREQTTMVETGPLGTVFTFLMWGVVIVGIALSLFWVISELVKYGGDDAEIGDKDGETRAAMPDLAVIDRPLGDAEELAKRGEFREAIHTLLLRTLQELVRSAAVSVKPAMTSREILARVPLLADARVALAGLITAVELTHFGGDDATIDDYVRCRTQFQRFATAFRAAGARADYHAAGSAA